MKILESEISFSLQAEILTVAALPQDDTLGFYIRMKVP